MKRVVLAMVIASIGTWAAAQETTRYFAAAASAEGANETFFKTDGRVFNPDADEEITVFVAFLESNRDNTGATEVEITIGPRRAAALDDLVGTFLGVTGAGGVRLRSDAPFLATSRTYNIGDGSSGTFGQFIPALTAEDALQQGILLSLVNDPAPSGFRSNVGFVNPTTVTVTVQYTVFDADTASVVGSGELSLPPLAFFQINNVFNAVGEFGQVVTNASVEFTASAAVLAYASVVDNTSGDPIFALPSADTGTPAMDNNPPEGTIVNPSGDSNATAGEPVSFVASVTDPDGDDVTGMEWDFGDDITASGLEVTHTYSEAGSYVVAFTATDEHGLADPTPDTRTITVSASTAATFTQVQSEIFDQSCAFSGCHGGGSASSGLSLSAGAAYGNIVNVPSVQQPSVDRIEPLDPASSYLWLKVTGDSSISGAQMPRGGTPLTQDKLDLLRSWIEAGAEDN